MANLTDENGLAAAGIKVTSDLDQEHGRRCVLLASLKFQPRSFQHLAAA